ncbi:hypothetical protein [Martelella soudanensis]|uniref:hypothetical protein n=1 Tax=unclassified Martelella TaxID=2629616 RepID=UPI0015DEDB9C|nr:MULTISPECIES: hypothetical protein [unclassified Martelella]
MQAALIAMTIFGCDDSLNQCSYIDMAETRYATVEACDGELEKALSAYDAAGYPTIIAVCREPGELVNVALGRNPDAGLPSSVTVPEKPSVASETDTPSLLRRLSGRSMAALMGIVPSRQTLGTVLTAPLHVVTDSYSWVVKKI